MNKPVLPNIYLVGQMAAGKSTIGKLLARELSRPFYDSDQEIEAQTGVGVAWIFDIEGEEGFRRREEAMIDELTKIDNIVLATGGGTILSEKCCRILRDRGFVIYLKVSLEEQVARTVRDKHRPQIQTSDRRGALEELYAEREPIYQAVADWTCLTDSGPGSRIVHEIYQYLAARFEMPKK